MNLAQIKRDFVVQHDQIDCGPACLASVIKYHGGNLSLDELRRNTGTTQTGTKLLGLYQGAKQAGFQVAGMEAENIENLKELDNPAILHILTELQLHHYVVFYGFENENLIIGDPAQGVDKWTKGKLEKVWKTKALLTLKPGKSFAKTQTKAGKYQNLIKWIKEDGNILIAALFLGLIIAIFSLATAVFSQKLIDVILPSRQLSKLFVGLALFAFILLARSALSYIRSSFLITQSKDFNNRMIDSFFSRLIHLPKPFFDSKKTGDMVARMNDTRRIQMVVSSLVGNLLIEILVLIISILGIYFYSWHLGLIVTFFVPLYLLAIWKYNKPIIASQKEVMSAYGLNEANFIDVISGISAIKTTGTLPLFHKLTTSFYSLFQQKIYDLGKLQVRFNFLTEFLGALLILSTISVSAYFVLEGSLLLGVMMAILSLASSIGPALTRIAVFNVQLQEAKVAFNRMEEFSGLEEEELSGKELDIIDSIEFDKVSFNFPGSMPLFQNISVRIERGSITTLMGESGTGKSTVSQLMQRFYNPISGTIKANGVATQNYNLADYRKQIGVVSQEIKIFNQYLLFNIALSDEPDDLERALNWCKASRLDHYFSRFPQGYDTLLGEEGVNISGGQKQLVALARALFRNPSVLILDEFTSAMDVRTENFILKFIESLKPSKAILIITHQAKIASRADVVYRLESEKITKLENHAELRLAETVMD